MARRLAREEGLFVGMSSGAIVQAAIELAHELGPGHRVACIAPDSASRYLSTELFEDGEPVGELADAPPSLTASAPRRSFSCTADSTPGAIGMRTSGH